MANPSTPTRHLALDNLRVVAMLLGLMLHGMLPFKATGIGRYPLRDCHTHVLADAVYFAVHDFRMQLFFAMAGFGAAALVARKGLGELVRNRARRIVLPLLIAVPLIAPLMHVLFTCHTAAARARPEPVGWTTIVSELEFGEWLGPNYHLWFLYVLAMCYLPLAGFWLLGERLPRTVVSGADRAFRFLLGGWWKALVLAAVCVPLLWPMEDWQVETPQGWLPDPVVIVYYIGFFLFGTMLFRHRDLLAGYGRRWPVMLLTANLLLLPAMLKLSVSGNWIEVETGTHPPAWLPLWKGTALFLGSLYTWLMIEGLIGVFQRFFSGRRPVWAYLTEASYWCYLAGFPVQVALQVWLADHPMSIAAKLVLVNAITFVVLLASYELCVRYTWIGLLLNGKRPEPRAATVVEPVVVAGRVRVGTPEAVRTDRQAVSFGLSPIQKVVNSVDSG